jgi:hypothetical protein
MTKIAYGFMIGLLLCGIAFCSSSTKSPSSDEGLAFFLPQSGEVKDWSRNESFEEYKGEDLFFYIDGGAEIYHEYGFERVIVQDYTSTNGKSVSLEIYEMTDPSSAYGMYSFKSSGEGKRLDVGNEGKLQDYYLNFWKGKYIVTLTGFDEEAETIKGLQSLARATDRRIKSAAPSEMPLIVRLLPQAGLKTQDVKYFQGNLGLFNSYPFTTKSIFKVKEAIKGSYEGGYDIYILKYESEEESRQIFQSAANGLKEESRYKSLQAKPGSIELIDEKDVHILMKTADIHIIIVLGVPGFGRAAEIAEALQNRIHTR